MKGMYVQITNKFHEEIYGVIISEDEMSYLLETVEVYDGLGAPEKYNNLIVYKKEITKLNHM